MVERGKPPLVQQEGERKVITHTDISRIFPDYMFEIAQTLFEQGIVIDDSEFHVPPKRHEYILDDGRVIISGAWYLVDGAEVGDNVIYIAFMEPGKKTTEHHHIGFEETYVPIAGELNVVMDRQHEHPLNGELTVPPNIKHYGVTHDNHALTLLIMKGARGVPKEQRHSH